jgi:bacteriocin-like protein
MENVMSKTNTTKTRELTEAELAAVSGGNCCAGAHYAVVTTWVGIGAEASGSIGYKTAQSEGYGN